MTRTNSVDWRRQWDEPLGLKETQANEILALLESARILYVEDRLDRADQASADAARLVKAARDKHHAALRLEAGLDQTT